MASSSSPSSHQSEYDVFINFRGVDTRFSVVDPLYSSLLSRGIATFWDDDQLHKEGDLPRENFEAIEKSRISVVIFSKNYASSTRCLDELAKILECMKSQRQIVLSIYYDVKPLHVKTQTQTGTFGKVFVEHANGFKDDLEKVKGWKSALTEATGLSGLDLNKNRRESKFIHEITEMILRNLNSAYLTYETDYLVGIDSPIREMNDLLGVGVADVRMVGIWGNRGMGKTTLATAVYNSVARKFDGACFLRDVAKKKSPLLGGLDKLQKTLLHDILGEEISSLTKDSGVGIIRRSLRNKKVLLIIDDVDDLNQLKCLAGSSDWFGVGSRIIITTRYEHLLLDHKVNFEYQVRELQHVEAMELFESKAFPTSRIPNDYQEPASRVVGYAQGNPLALIVVGSFLCGKSIYEWYERAQNNQEIVKIIKKEDERREREREEDEWRERSRRNCKAFLQDGVNATETNTSPAGGDETNADTQTREIHELGDVTYQGTIGIQRQESLLEQPDGIWSSAKSFSSKVFSAEWMFLIVSLMLEIFSAICDQLSSPRKPLYALFGMGLANMALATCIWEFIHKGKRAEVQFGKCGKLLWWFYYPRSGTLFGTFPEICGLIYAITQWASSVVQLVCMLQNKDNPFKVNILPVLFLVCLVVSKLIRNARGRTTSDGIGSHC